MKIRHLWLGLAAAALAAMPAQAADSIRIGLSAQNLFTAPIFVAQKLGYFKDANLEPEITAFRGGAAAQEALSVGAVDMISYLGSGLALAVSKGAKQKIVAAIEPGPYAWHLLVAAKSPYKTVKDLAGKKVGITTKASTSDLLALWAAQRAGITVQTVPVGSAGQVPSLKSGAVDAIAINPTSLQLIANGTARSLVDFGKDVEPMLADSWGASQEIIDKRPDVLRRSLGAIYKGLAYMRANREWSLQFLKEFTHEDDERVVALSYEQGTLAQSADGHVDRAWVRAALDQAAAMWSADDVKGLTIDSVYDSRFAPVSKPE